MLSNDELTNGVTFILELSDAVDAPARWVQRLYGDAAAHWFDIYRRSDWKALRAEGGDVFRNRITESEAEHLRTSQRCVVIHTSAVAASEIVPPPRRVRPPQPGWENDGGSLAPPAS